MGFLVFVYLNNNCPPKRTHKLNSLCATRSHEYMGSLGISETAQTLFNMHIYSVHKGGSSTRRKCPAQVTQCKDTSSTRHTRILVLRMVVRYVKALCVLGSGPAYYTHSPTECSFGLKKNLTW